jgi:hypothetical protein
MLFCQATVTDCFSHLLLSTPFLQAFAKSGVSLDAPAATIAEVLKYHKLTDVLCHLTNPVCRRSQSPA